MPRARAFIAGGACDGRGDLVRLNAEEGEGHSAAVASLHYSLAEFLDRFQTPGVLSERLALLTFDDAYRSLRGAALRRLREFGYPAAVFVPTAFIEGKNEFDRGREPEEEICTWEDLHELARGGVSVQSHGASHREKPTDSELVEEIGKSKEILQSQLGTRIEAFAYPYGNAGSDYERIREALRQAGYRAAFLADGGRLKVPLDVYRLNRLVMLPWTDLLNELTRCITDVEVWDRTGEMPMGERLVLGIRVIGASRDRAFTQALHKTLSSDGNLSVVVAPRLARLPARTSGGREAGRIGATDSRATETHGGSTIDSRPTKENR